MLRTALLRSSLVAASIPRKNVMLVSRSFSELGKSTYSGPYTEDEVHKLEKFAMDAARQYRPSQKLVDPWLRAKLGPYYKEFWQQRVISREEEEKKRQRAVNRPPTSTHFTVSHPSQDAVQDEDKDAFAVIGLAGTQYKVASGDVVICNKLPEAEVGTKIELTDILLVGYKSKTIIGRPTVPDYVVTAFVEQQAKEKKQYAFYKKPKTFSQKMRGFRREVTILRINDIRPQAQTSSQDGTKV